MGRKRFMGNIVLQGESDTVRKIIIWRSFSALLARAWQESRVTTEPCCGKGSPVPWWPGGWMRGGAMGCWCPLNCQVDGPSLQVEEGPSCNAQNKKLRTARLRARRQAVFTLAGFFLCLSEVCEQTGSCFWATERASHHG